MYKAGIQIGREENHLRRDEDNIIIGCHAEYSNLGSQTKQTSNLIIDKDFNTLQMNVIHDSKHVNEEYSFEYKNKEAFIKVNQKSKIKGWQGKQIDTVIYWNNQCLVLPSINNYYPLVFLCRKYIHEKKGKQEVGCGIVPKTVFSLDYLGEDTIQVDNMERNCRRFKLFSSKDDSFADIWVNEKEEIFRMLIPPHMVSIQSYRI